MPPKKKIKPKHIKQAEIVPETPRSVEPVKPPSKKREDVHITCAIMCKNEEKRICVSLDSVKTVCKSITIFDTGSTDKTVEIIQEWSKKNNVPLRLKQGTFVDFSTSRNTLLSFCDEFQDVDYVLMLDTNDELKTPTELLNSCHEYLDKFQSSFMLKQEWFSGALTNYLNVRLIKPRHYLTYKGVVHEYISCDKPELTHEPVRFGHVVLYQDRTVDDNKSFIRFARDKVLLQKEFDKNPEESRTTFYLAQTYECLGDFENAYHYYKIRSTQLGFHEEVYEAYLRCGKCAMHLKLDIYEAIKWFLKCYNHSKRVEPLCYLANIYKDMKDYDMAHMFIKRACELKYPENSLLFVDKHKYNYDRYHILGIVSYYIGKHTDGLFGCNMAIKNGTNRIDKENMEYYLNREKEGMDKIDVVDYFGYTLKNIMSRGEDTFEKAVQMTLKIILNKFKK